MVNPWVCYGKTLESGAKAKTTVHGETPEETIALHKPVKKPETALLNKRILQVVEALTTVENQDDTRE